MQSSTRELTLCAAGSHARTLATRLVGATEVSMEIGRDYGIRWPVWSSEPPRGFAWSKTSTAQHGGDGCPQCGATCIDSDIPACRFECEPLTWERRLLGAESLLPRPTAKANQLAPSMRKWRSCRNLQNVLGTGGAPPVSVWGWMMGFPAGWLCTGTPLSRNRPK